MHLVYSPLGASLVCTRLSAVRASCRIVDRVSSTSNSAICSSMAHEHSVLAEEHLQQAALVLAAAGLAGPALFEAAYDELKPKKCMECLGTGFLICNICQGRGKLGLRLPGDSSAIKSCYECHKRGRCRCSKCNATGLENNWLWQPAADPGWGPRGS